MTEPETWCTDWAAYDVPRLWAMVSTEDSSEAWAQVSAWFRLRDAVDDQRERLAACRQALIAVWPPERSEASTAFLAVLDELVGSMTDTVAAADSTARGLAGVLESLATAKKQIKPLYDEWVARSTDLTPRWIDGAEDELNAKARAVMVEAESAVAHFTPMIKSAARYELDIWRDPGSLVDPGERSIGVSRTPSPVPPVPHDPPLPLPGLSPAVSRPPDAPVLAGGLVPAPTPVPPPQLSAPATPPHTVPGQSDPLVPAPAWLVPTSRGPGLTPGGIIGSTVPSVPTATPTRSTASGSAAARGTVPGLVGPGSIPSGAAVPARPSIGAGADRSGHPPRHLVPPAGNGYRTPDGHVVTVSGLGPPHASTPQRPPGDPLDPWAVHGGIPPVVTPDPPRQHDCGQGVIGIDR